MKLYHYTFKSPLYGSIYCENLFVDTHNTFDLNPEVMARLYDRDHRLADFLEQNSEDLTNYMRHGMSAYVQKLEVGDYGIINGQMCLLAHVRTTSKMTDEQAQEVMDYISGQYSDGWGEGLEQREWREDKVYFDNPIFDENTGDWEQDEDYEWAQFYAHAWNRDCFSIELLYCEEEEVPDPEPFVHSAKCERLSEGGYRVRTVYQMINEEDVLNHIKNSGLMYSDEFYNWVKNWGTFGEESKLYLIVVNEGWCNKILPMLGVMHKDKSCNLFGIEAETGYVQQESYLDSESQDFYKDMMDK